MPAGTVPACPVTGRLLGRLTPQNNVDTLPRGAGRAACRPQRLLTGDGPDRPALLKRVRRGSGPRRLHLLMWRPSPRHDATLTSANPHWQTQPSPDLLRRWIRRDLDWWGLPGASGLLACAVRASASWPLGGTCGGLG
jgi:hypothetical protein